MNQTCPCHSGNPYQTCCAPLHQGQPASNAERLMRSRYCAYVMKLDAYLHQSWHHSTRPADLTREDLTGIDWVMLEILDAPSSKDGIAYVTFKAHYKMGENNTQVLHETSRFVLETNAQNQAHWFYVDGVIHQDN